MGCINRLKVSTMLYLRTVMSGRRSTIHIFPTGRPVLSRLCGHAVNDRLSDTISPFNPPIADNLRTQNRTQESSHALTRPLSRCAKTKPTRERDTPTGEGP